jgi:spermidine synthase
VRFRFPLLLICFFLSGFAALLYETAWTREFGFVFGTSELAIAAVLAAYMAGLALGAAVAGRVAHRLRRPVLVYGALELGIALCALAVPVGIRAVTALYVALFGGRAVLPDQGGVAAAAFHLLGSFAILVPCTALMGATLPLLARYAVRRDEQVGPRIGALYAINTAGAIAGTVCAAFVLLPELGLRSTVHVGVAVNALVFAAAALLARGAQLPAETAEESRRAIGRVHWILPLIAISGVASFIYEVLWTRLLGLVLGGSVYAFATMLASFLLGITLGSAFAARVARTPNAGARGFALAQIGTAALSLAAFAMADRLPALAQAVGAGGSGDPLGNALVSVVVLLPVTLCIGATFPFAVRLMATGPEQASAASARVYAWNTIGAIGGAIGAGFVLLPWLGFAGTLTVGVAMNLALAAAAGLWTRPRRTAPVALAAVGLVALVVFAPGPPWTLLRSSSFIKRVAEGEVEYLGVGRSATVLMLDSGRDWQLRTNGLPEAIIERPEENPGRFPEGRWMGMLPVMTRPQSRDLLVIGLGGGVALEAIPSTLTSVDVIELEPEVVTANQIVSGRRAVDPLADPRISMHINDARGALLLSGMHYDAIVSQPSHPWTAGSSHLYTREFFRLVRTRLDEGGVFVQWIGIAFVNEDLLRTLVATLGDVFRYVEIYRPSPAALLFAASDEPFDVVTSARDALAAAPESFARYGLYRPEDIAAALILDAESSRAFAEGAPVSTDDANLLATRSPRIGESALSAPDADRLFAPYDPLVRYAPRLDGVALVRRLLERSNGARAKPLAESLDGVSRDTALGWVELGRGRRRAALQSFERALERDPDATEARQGYAMLAPKKDPNAERAIEARPGDAPWMAVLRGPDLRAGDDWTELAELDAQLARVQPGDPLFRKAAELRAEWRVESGETPRAAEALEIVDRALARGGSLQLYLLRARAAAADRQPKIAWTALEHLASALGKNPAARRLARRAQVVAAGLPASPRGERVRARLRQAAR